MKRFVSLCLTGLLLCGLIPLEADAVERVREAFTDVVYSNDFTDYPYESHLGGLNCNSPLPEDNLKIWYDAGHGHVLKASMQKAGNDGHYIRVYGGEHGSTFVSQTGCRWEIAADVSLDTETRLDVSVWMGAAQTFFVPLRLSAGGNIECGYPGDDGTYKKYMRYQPGEWYQIKLYLDLANNTYSLAVNGQLLESDTPYSFPYNYFYAALYFGMNDLTDGITSVDHWMYLDNIRVSQLDSFGYDYQSDEGYRYIAFSDDFESGMSSELWKIPDPSGIARVPDPSGKRGQVVRFSGTYPRLYSNYDVPGKKLITEHYTTEEIQRVRICADMRFDDLNNAAFNLMAYDAYSGKIGTLISFNKDNPIYYPFNQTAGLNLTKAGEWKSGTWYTVTLYLDMVRGLGTAKVTDGTTELILLEDFDLTGWEGYHGTETRIDALRIEAGTSTEGAAYVDNVTYAVMAPSVKLCRESDTSGRAYYTYYPDLFGGGAATLFVAVSKSDRLNSVKPVSLTPNKLTPAEVADKGPCASSMTDGLICAHHAVSVVQPYTKQADETVRFYLWSDASGCVPLDKQADLAELDTEETISDLIFEKAITQWRKTLVGDSSHNTEDAIVAQSISAITENAKSAWNRQKRYAEDNDVLFLPITTTADMTQQYVFLSEMAKAWGTMGSTLYQNSELLNDIVSGLDWMYERYYGQNEIDGNAWRNPALYNWWDWLVGTPVALTETLLIIGDAIGKDRVERYLSPAAFFLATEGPQHDDGSRVANGLALALLLHNSRMLHKYMQDLETILQIKPQTFGVNGLKEDGTYIEHMMYLYNAGYGVSIIGQRGLELYSIFKNTGLLPPSIDTAVIDLAIHETFEPILYDGCLLSSFSGRRSIGETDGGEQILAVLLDVVDSFEGVERQRICQMIRRNVLADMLPSLVQRLTVHQASVLSKILAEDGQSVGTAYERAKVYYAGDAVVQQKNGYAAALSMSSERRANYESINGMNLTGWYQSDGALYVYTEGAQFDKDWWTGRNPYHMPGVTADTQQREEKSIYYTEGYLSNQDIEGGVELDKFAVAAMALESFHNETDSGMTDVGYGGSQSVHHSSLTAKKAWFFLDDEIVCLGSDIRAQDGYEVQTTLDNRLLSGNEAVTIGGGLLSADETTANAPGWAHIENFGGYWLPEAEALHVKKTKGTNTFLELWLSHGVNPTAASYCYAVLPKATAAATKAYHANPNVRIIENSGAVQAVCDSEAGLKGIVFWEAAACEGISADAPMTVLIQEQGNTLCIAVSDPTHKLTTSTLRLNGRYTLRSASDRITVGNGADDTELIINFAENCGQTLTAELEIY